MATPSNILTIRVAPETRQRLNLLASAAKVSMSEIARALLDNPRGTEAETPILIARLREEIDTNTAEQYGQIEALIAAQNELAEGVASLQKNQEQAQNEVAEALNNLAKAVAKLYETAPQRAQYQPPITKPTAPQPAADGPAQTGTGETWQAWITRQPLIYSDDGKPSARARRLWRQYAPETGLPIPENVRSQFDGPA
jgi:predicted transcriptional regulator